MVFDLIQKYKFESKSQRQNNAVTSLTKVFDLIQKYKFESKSQLVCCGIR